MFEAFLFVLSSAASQLTDTTRNLYADTKHPWWCFAKIQNVYSFCWLKLITSRLCFHFNAYRIQQLTLLSPFEHYHSVLVVWAYQSLKLPCTLMQDSYKCVPSHTASISQMIITSCIDIPLGIRSLNEVPSKSLNESCCAFEGAFDGLPRTNSTLACRICMRTVFVGQNALTN